MKCTVSGTPPASAETVNDATGAALMVTVFVREYEHPVCVITVRLTEGFPVVANVAVAGLPDAEPAVPKFQLKVVIGSAASFVRLVNKVC